MLLFEWNHFKQKNKMKVEFVTEKQQKKVYSLFPFRLREYWEILKI